MEGCTGVLSLETLSHHLCYISASPQTFAIQFLDDKNCRKQHSNTRLEAKINTFKIARVSVGMDRVDLMRAFVRTKNQQHPQCKPANVTRIDSRKRSTVEGSDD